MIGLPSMAWSMNAIYRPGMCFREDTREIYVTWGSKDCAEDMARAAIDDIAWTEVPLSEWFAWQEQLEQVAA